MTHNLPTIAVLGASGLIGEAVASGLAASGWIVTPIARRFSAAQNEAFGAAAVESMITELDPPALAQMLSLRRVDLIVNCIGVLQDSGRDQADNVHRRFLDRLTQAMRSMDEPPLLVHLSVPGQATDDATVFSKTKRAGEAVIASAGVDHVILRPGFVIAPAAYGGSALIRALAASPFALPVRLASGPVAATDIADVVATIDQVGRRWRSGERSWTCVWDVMEAAPATVDAVVDAFRRRFGGPRPIGRLPVWLLDVGAWAGDLAAMFGWRPPVRGTALSELRRGVMGDPGPWIAATGLTPTSLHEALEKLPSTTQERWFARLYLLKAVMIVSMVGFWCLSGVIALTAAFEAASAILTSHGFPAVLARGVTVGSSLTDICIGAAIAFRRTSRTGLVAGIGLSLFYMVGASFITPDLWLDPLGALVKTGPAIVLMIVTLAVLQNR